MTADPMIVRAFAKINLVLRVGAKRPDGYHELVTLIARVGLADVLLIDAAAHTTVTCPGLPGGDTLVTRALELLCEASGYDEGFSVHIDKRIPHGAGLGGGSADAAAALRFANELLPTPLIASELARIAGLAHPGHPLATRDVYAADHPVDRPLPSTLALPTTLDELVDVVENDLAVPAEQLEPACTALREELVAAGALTANVSGSGSVVFGIFATEQEAEAASANLIHAKWKVTSTLGIR